MSSSNQKTQILNWDSARELLNPINPDLTSIIDQINPDSSFKMVKHTLSYGDYIVDNGKFNLNPDSAHLIDYSSIPLFLSLEKNLEVFVTNQDRVIPLNVLEKGELIGLFETTNAMFNMSQRAPWSVSAGSRSLCLLPKIADRLKYQKLKKTYRNIPSHHSNTLNDHWQLCKSITQNEQCKSSWKCDILIFTRDWFNPEKNDNYAWSQFYTHIFRQAWQTASFSLSKIQIDLKWEQFIDVLNQKRLKLSSYITDTVKHLWMMSIGQCPGYIPAIENENFFPKKTLQDIFLHDYGLDQYIPTFMHAAPLNTIYYDTIYYSLSFPSLLGGSPTPAQHKTIVEHMSQIMTCIETLCDAKESNQLQNIFFSYFHTEQHDSTFITESDKISDTDKRFFNDQKKFPTHTIAYRSRFWKGCIGLKAKNEL